MSQFNPHQKLLSLGIMVDSVLFQNELDTFAIIRGTQLETKSENQELDFENSSDPNSENAKNPTKKRAATNKDANNKITAKGNIGKVSPGESLSLHGRWVEHAVHGKQFQVELAVPIIPENKQGLVKFLGSGLVPGLGPALALRIVNKFGDQTMHIATKQSAKLADVKGIGKAKARQIGEAVRNKRLEAETLTYLYSLGIGSAHARQVIKSYGEKTVSLLRENPYVLAEQIQGIGFKTADQIGKSLGIEGDDPRRASGAVIHFLGKAADSGHTFLTKNELQKELEQAGISQATFQKALELLSQKKLIVIEEENIFPPPLFEAEVEIAERLNRFHQKQNSKESFKEIQKQLNQSFLSSDQQNAVIASLHHKLMILTGGPGTGKTTTVRYIVEAQKTLKKKIVLCAPTGKAAKRLSEATLTEAKTIHRLLGWNPATGHFNHHETEPMDAEVILVDEASMLDIRLSASLLKAIPDKASIIFVGDVDQLPPVSAGPLFREMLKTDIGEQVRLKQIFRQAQNSPIVSGAYQVLHGKMPSSSSNQKKQDKNLKEGELFVIEADTPERIRDKLRKVINRIPRAYGLDSTRDTQVLTPTHRGPLGTEELNFMLQNQLNTNASNFQKTQVSDRQKPIQRFFPDDKVIQTKNNYDKEVFNGDMGFVTHVNKEKVWVQFEDQEVAFSQKELDALSLSYATTIHKVQGSEFPAVVILLHSSHWTLLSRALLYTAMTRAKNLVVLIGNQSAISRAVKNQETFETHCDLHKRISKKLHSSSTQEVNK